MSERLDRLEALAKSLLVEHRRLLDQIKQQSTDLANWHTQYWESCDRQLELNQAISEEIKALLAELRES